jgi:hypothetical protein
MVLDEKTIERSKLEQQKPYNSIIKFSYNASFTFGNKDKEKREQIRKAASLNISAEIKKYKYYAFEIKVIKKGKRSFDLDNVPKLIIDSFCEKQIEKDKSRYKNLAFYPDDSLEYVIKINLEGRKAILGEEDKTEVEILGMH